MASRTKSQLVFANFSNDISIKPYAIFVDHDKQVILELIVATSLHTHKAIVISIRGTLSLEDCVTDAMAHSESLEAAGIAIVIIVAIGT